MGGGGKHNEYWVTAWSRDKTKDPFEHITRNSNDRNCKEQKEIYYDLHFTNDEERVGSRDRLRK